MRDYLHDCLKLHPQVAEARYGRVQQLASVEHEVRRELDGGGDLSRVIHAIFGSKGFDATIFGPRPEVERTLRGQDWYAGWRRLSDYQLAAKLYGVYRQIEPVSMVLRFALPERFGIFSAPVANVLGMRQRRRQTTLYAAYLKSLSKLRSEREFERVADVEMALWALQLGVVERLLPERDREALAKAFSADTALRRMRVRNLTTELFSEWRKLDLAEALCYDQPKLAGQIAGIEFERLVGRWVGNDTSLKENIDQSPTSNDQRERLHRARDTRNRAIHGRKVTQRDICELAATARWIENQVQGRSK